MLQYLFEVFIKKIDFLVVTLVFQFIQYVFLHKYILTWLYCPYNKRMNFISAYINHKSELNYY